MDHSTLTPAAASLLLVIIAVEDWRSRRIRHLLTIPGTAAAITLSSHLPARFWLNATVGAAVGFILFLAIRVLAHRYYGEGAFGFGDVMLATLIGAIGGISGILWLAMGMLFAGCYAAWLIRRGQIVNDADSDTTESHIAYGSFLAVAAIFGVVANDMFVL